MTFNEANTVEAFIQDLLCGELPESITGLSEDGVEESPSILWDLRSGVGLHSSHRTPAPTAGGDG